MGTIKKYQAGGKSALGMKSVKAGFDKNPGVTRADIIVAAKKEAKGGAKLKKQAAVAIAMKAAGKKPKKARGGTTLAPSKTSTSNRLASYGRPLGKNLKKAQTGVKLNTSQYKRLGRLRAKNPAKAERVGGRMVERATRLQRGKDYLKSHQYELMPSAKKGTKLKMGGKCRGGCY